MGLYMTRQIAYDIEKDTKLQAEIMKCTLRYFKNDWGNLCDYDKELNEKAIKYGGRILATYQTVKGKIYIITDETKAKIQTTTILYANEY